jgi:hypothetical protein
MKDGDYGFRLRSHFNFMAFCCGLVDAAWIAVKHR